MKNRERMLAVLRRECLLGGLALAAMAMLLIRFGVCSSAVRPPLSARAASFSQSLSGAPEKLAELPVARRNLLCAQGLSSTNEPDIGECLATLAAWARRIQAETERHQYRFRRNPAEYENSEGFFRMLIMAVVLEEDFKVHYDNDRRMAPGESRPNDGFFSDPASVFLHGLLGPRRQGTCSSMPVLYAAIGRELGYPLKLVTTKAHLFVRWDGSGERFNIEVTGHGLNRFDDEYYRHWPFEITPAEEAAEGYLRSLTPAEELAVFLSIRGMCLREAGRPQEAADAFAGAVRLAPGCASYRAVLAHLRPGWAISTNPNQQ